jgi:hypothetical protein
MPPSEFKARKAPGTESGPKLLLFVRLLTSQRARQVRSVHDSKPTPEVNGDKRIAASASLNTSLPVE